MTESSVSDDSLDRDTSSAAVSSLSLPDDGADRDTSPSAAVSGSSLSGDETDTDSRDAIQNQRIKNYNIFKILHNY